MSPTLGHVSSSVKPLFMQSVVCLRVHGQSGVCPSSMPVIDLGHVADSYTLRIEHLPIQAGVA